MMIVEEEHESMGSDGNSADEEQHSKGFKLSTFIDLISKLVCYCLLLVFDYINNLTYVKVDKLLILLMTSLTFLNGSITLMSIINFICRIFILVYYI